MRKVPSELIITLNINYQGPINNRYLRVEILGNVQFSELVADLVDVFEIGYFVSSAFVIEPPVLISLPVTGDTKRFAVNRIYCVGRNYADHAREMGHDPDREPKARANSPLPVPNE